MATANKTVIAKFDMKGCIRCGQPITAGKDQLEQIVMPNGRKRWVHVGCEATGVMNAGSGAVPADAIRQIVDTAVAPITEEISTINQRVNSLSESNKSGGMNEDERRLIARLADEHRKLEERVQLLDKARPVVIDARRSDGKTYRVLEGEHAHPKLQEVVFHVKCGDNVMLVGPSGCGKTHLAQQIARVLGLEFDFVSCSIDTTKSEIFGSREPDGDRFVYQMSPFGKRYRDGGVFLWDEVDAIDSNVFLALNAPLSNRVLSMPKNYDMPKIEQHPDFVCLCAANTYGGGGDRRYVGRNRLDGASLDRFVFIELDYDVDVEIALCPDAELLNELWGIRRRCNELKIERFVTTRFIQRAYRWKQEGMTNEYCKEVLMRTWREDERRKVCC